MLVLSRKKDEQIVMDTESGRIVLTVTKIKGSSAFIGIDAPDCVRIARSEVMERDREDEFGTDAVSQCSRAKR